MGRENAGLNQLKIGMKESYKEDLAIHFGLGWSERFARVRPCVRCSDLGVL